MNIARVLTVAGSDSGGGAGIQADLKTITTLGGYGASVLTALTAQNTLGVQGIHELPAAFIEQQFDSVLSDIGADAIKTGMLSNSDTIRAVAGKIREYRMEKLVVDPVMIAKGGAALLQNEAEETLRTELLPLALLVTPNIPEAEVLSDTRISSPDDMRNAARKIRQLGCRNVLIKGGHAEGDALDILYDGEEFYEFVTERIDTKDTHGTGCTFSAAIATSLAQGKELREAVRQAKEYITCAIRFALRIGRGHGPTNHAAALFRETARYRCLQELKAAIQNLKSGKLGHLIPEIQSNLGYALPYAQRISDVAAVPGRLLNVRGRIESVCDPEFGASKHVASIILTLMQYDAEYRSAMNIRFSEEILAACKKAGLSIDSFNRANEPDDVKQREGSSLEWGTHHVLSQRQDIPDVIFDRGDVGKEPIIRILGKTPDAVVEKILHIAECL